MAGSPDEKKLVRRARGGDQEAFRLLLREYQTPVFNLALRILRSREDAEDASQEVFVKVYNALHQYDPRYAFRSWIFRITHNLCIDYIRRRKMSTLSLDAPVAGPEGEMEWDLPDPDAIDPSEAASAGEEREMIERAIEKLGPTLRSAITLRHLEGLRYDEIAEILEIPLGTVKVRIFRAREMLAKFLSRPLGRDKK
jgi:RNA polymerase sigma-70 factor (ECF subfamily)